MPNGMYGGVRGKETKVGQKTFVSRPTRCANSQTHFLSQHLIGQLIQSLKQRDLSMHKVTQSSQLNMFTRHQ